MTNPLPNRYSPPVDRLLHYGDCRKLRDWPNYLELGLTAEHIPELIRMALDDNLHYADSDTLEVWAPVHAWRSLGQLHAEAAIKPLLALLARTDEDAEDDWTPEELPYVFAEIGSAAVPDLTRFLADDRNGVYSRTAAAYGLQHLAEKQPPLRDGVIAVLSQQLEQFGRQAENFNAFLIAALVDMKAREALPIIERAFAAGAVEEFVTGDWEDVQIEFGLKVERETPQRNYFLESFSPEPEKFLQAVTDELQHLRQLDRQSAKKEKSKRKQAKQMRKKNRKK